MKVIQSVVEMHMISGRLARRQIAGRRAQIGDLHHDVAMLLQELLNGLHARVLSGVSRQGVSAWCEARRAYEISASSYLATASRS